MFYSATLETEFGMKKNNFFVLPDKIYLENILLIFSEILDMIFLNIKSLIKLSYNRYNYSE